MNIDNIINLGCEFFNIKRDELNNPSRRFEFNLHRHVIWYFCRKYTGCTLREIGLKTGRRNHATVLSGIRSVNNQIDTDFEYRMLIDRMDTFLDVNKFRTPEQDRQKILAKYDRMIINSFQMNDIF